jgi:hypothetical protein
MAMLRQQRAETRGIEFLFYDREACRRKSEIPARGRAIGMEKLVSDHPLPSGVGKVEVSKSSRLAVLA